MNEQILNPYYDRLPGSYLFSTIAKKIKEYQASHEDADIIRLGIGDVTTPLIPQVISAMHKAVDEMALKDSFRGYGPEQGYDFLREAIVRGEYIPRGVNLDPGDVFVSDGSKCDVANIQELFAEGVKIAIPDPVYPVYLDSNVMAGRTGVIDSIGHFTEVTYLSSTAENNFQPDLPKNPVQLIYLCSPNNPTGTVLSRETLQKFVDYANANGALILFDGAYNCYIQDENLPHSIYEIEGAENCAIEFRSFSKTAGFTGIRCAYTVVPHQLQKIHAMWNRRQCTKFNGVSYVTQRAAEAIYTAAGWQETQNVISGYMKTAALIRNELTACGYTVFGGEHAPYIWWKLPKLANGVQEKSFDFFDRLLSTCEVVGTPGSGFGPCGEGYFRLTAFGDHEQTKVALQRIKERL
ncbi:MAG: LL-diaminopimelate aminotransferase [Fibrobacteraceae bacterium]|nr:LL-diaminopimelate aminotransferase [Fibrobacteraceae bacterium]